MKESACGLFRHTPIPVRGAGHDSFEKAQDTSHLGDLIESRNDMDF
jgi:hypothetical protein